MNTLIQLALIDGELDNRERAFIYNVCLRNNVDLDTIGDMIEKPEPIGDLSNIKLQERIEYLTECFQLMLIDGKVLPREVQYLLGIASLLGFDQSDCERLIEEVRIQVNISSTDLKLKVSNLVAKN